MKGTIFTPFGAMVSGYFVAIFGVTFLAIFFVMAIAVNHFAWHFLIVGISGIVGGIGMIKQARRDKFVENAICRNELIKEA